MMILAKASEKRWTYVEFNRDKTLVEDAKKSIAELDRIWHDDPRDMWIYFDGYQVSPETYGAVLTAVHLSKWDETIVVRLSEEAETCKALLALNGERIRVLPKEIGMRYCREAVFIHGVVIVPMEDLHEGQR